MKLLSVEGSNVGLLKGLFKLDFNGSLTAITGPIGVGKSTLLTMIKATLTNSVPGSGASWVSWGCDSSEPSYFKATWHFDDKVVEIVKPMVDSAAFKALDLPRVRITDFEGNLLTEVFTASEASTVLQEVLPVTAKVVDSHLVIDQDKISHPTNSTPAKFQETIHTLTRVNEIEKVRAKVRESLASYVVPEVSELVATTKSDLAELTSDLATKQMELDNAIRAISGVDPKALADQIIEAESSRDTQAKVLSLKKDIENLEGLIARDEKDIAEVGSAVIVDETYLSSKEDTYKEAAKVVGSFRSLEAAWNKQQLLSEEISVLETRLVSLRRPETAIKDVPDTETVNSLKSEVVRLQTVGSGLTRQIHTCESGECSLCGQSTESVNVEGLAAKKAAISEAVKDTQQLITNAESIIKEYDAYQEKVRTFDEQVKQLTTKIKVKEEGLDPNALPVVESSLSEAKDLMNKYESVRISLAERKGGLKCTQDRVAVYRESLKTRGEELGATPNGDTVFNPTHYQSLVEAQQALESLKMVRYGLVESVKEKQAGVDRVQERLDSYQKRADQAEPILQYRDLLSRAETILQKDQLPKLLSAQYMTEINEKITEYLTLIEAEFGAWINDDLEFMVKKSDGLIHKASRLSGGQKQQASIAYLLAVNDVFASSLGVLILDEPTGSMQEENAKDVAEAFGKLLQVGKATNRQFIVVTHSQSLAEYSDQRIEMPLT